MTGFQASASRTLADEPLLESSAQALDHVAGRADRRGRAGVPVDLKELALIAHTEELIGLAVIGDHVGGHARALQRRTKG